MTGPGQPPEAYEITVGNALRHADTADEVVLRVLAGLRAAGGPRTGPQPHRTTSDWPLPRRIPGLDPGPYAPWADQPLVPAVREASAIATNTSNYLRGWRLGNEAVRAVRAFEAARPAAAAAVAAPIPPPALPGVVRRRIAARTGAAAMRLIGLVVQALPAGERPRYQEEFRAELSRLHGLHQLGYATRLLLSMFALRRALRQTRVEAE
ncbi:hypothetical protein GCM10022225_36150 [Plantactinospora mayteni]|uniref:Uncharacterized protein n=1 Tax=Plantactinospora mayteni TaxID=566021 RepID=A0ABQ4EM05_9ACTN|nr:hypothetical protein [Plantactinospora mayteni]GIG95774.1 hypothetical protein Pma05_23470 [Plantactinospora mayteni]